MSSDAKVAASPVPVTDSNPRGREHSLSPTGPLLTCGERPRQSSLRSLFNKHLAKPPRAGLCCVLGPHTAWPRSVLQAHVPQREAPRGCLAGSTVRALVSPSQAGFETGCPRRGGAKTCRAWQSRHSDPWHWPGSLPVSLSGLSLSGLPPQPLASPQDCPTPPPPALPLNLPDPPASPTPPLPFLPAPHHPFPVESSWSPFRRQPRTHCCGPWPQGAGSAGGAGALLSVLQFMVSLP